MPRALRGAESGSPACCAARALADGGRERTLALGAHTVRYRLKRSSRRTIGFTIGSHGLAVTAPRWVSLADIETAIAGKARWILTKLDAWQARSAERALAVPVWAAGTRFSYLGGPLMVDLAERVQAPRLDESAGRLVLGLAAPSESVPPPGSAIEHAVHAWLTHQAARIFAERLDHYAARMDVDYQQMRLSSARTRWGSCTSDGRIRLHWRLIHFPLEVIDYVVVHELAHRCEMNHSARFWAVVAAVLPAFEEARRTLKQHAPLGMPQYNLS